MKTFLKGGIVYGVPEETLGVPRTPIQRRVNYELTTGEDSETYVVVAPNRPWLITRVKMIKSALSGGSIIGVNLTNPVIFTTKFEWSWLINTGTAGEVEEDFSNTPIFLNSYDKFHVYCEELSSGSSSIKVELDIVEF